MGIDDVSVFDTLPYCSDATKDVNILREAGRVFERMLEAKKPDVVLCCYQVDPFGSSIRIVKELSSKGVGQVHQELSFPVSDGWTLKRVNAFHPSYAVNYYRMYGCFRRLLLVEFVQAFAHCSGGGVEDQWIKDLRQDCASMASKLRKVSNMFSFAYITLAELTQ
jgi:hypothetical protein